MNRSDFYYLVQQNTFTEACMIVLRKRDIRQVKVTSPGFKRFKSKMAKFLQGSPTRLVRQEKKRIKKQVEKLQLRLW